MRAGFFKHVVTPSNWGEQTGLQLSFSFNNRRGEAAAAAAASCCSAVLADGGAEAERYRGRRNQVSGSRLDSEGRDVRLKMNNPQNVRASRQVLVHSLSCGITNGSWKRQNFVKSFVVC